MMHIVFDGQAFSIQSRGGVSRYYFEVARRLRTMAGCAVSIMAGLHRNEYVRAAPWVRGRYVRPVPRSARLRVFANHMIMRSWIRKSRPDLIHETFYWKFSGHRTLPRAVTVYDMIHELFPADFSRNDPTNRLKAAAVARAQHIFCISQKTRDDLLNRVPSAAGRVSVTYLASSLNISRAQAGCALDRPYLLYVGGRRSGYKNFDGILRALAASPRLAKDFVVLCVGGRPFSTAEHELARELGVAHCIRQIQADDDFLVALYRDAAALVYPSLYEGFGLPPLEAMGIGCPVICGAVGALPEVVGDAAQIVEPNDPQSMASGMETVAYNRERAEQLRNAGRQRASQFSWDRCAAEMHDAYLGVTGGSA